MKKILVIYVLVLFIGGCDDAMVSNSKLSKKDNSCVEPQNPYNDGGGHDAGFNWALENSGSYCDGNSESFYEGCVEYLRQLNKYNKCVSS